MDNNSILRRIRYTFSFDDTQMIKLFALGNRVVSRAEVSDWLKREGEESYVEMKDKDLAFFLNGFIVDKRGKQEGREPVAEDRLNNNMILRKLKIALNIKSEDITELFALVNKRISVSEIGAFLRHYSHSKYREFNGQYLRNFMNGLQAKYHVDK